MSSFTRGQPTPYRATTRIHLGEHEVDIYKDDVVLFDGQTLTIGQDKYSAPKLRAAITQLGWLVPADDLDSEYRPMAAGIRVSPAKEADKSKDIEMGYSADEEAVVGSRRTANVGMRDGREVPEAQENRRSMRVERENLNEDAVPVSRLSSPKKTTTVANADAALRATKSIDDGRSIQRAKPVDRIPNDELDNLLDDTVSTPRQPAGVAGEGNNPHMTPEERRAARLASLRAQVAEAEAEVAADEEASDVDEVDTPSDTALAEAKLAGIKAVLPDFDWDLNEHWRKRVSKAVEQADNTAYFNAIMAVETDTVKKHIKKQLG